MQSGQRSSELSTPRSSQVTFLMVIGSVLSWMIFKKTESDSAILSPQK